MNKDKKYERLNDFPEAAYDWMALLESGDITPEEYEAFLDWRDGAEHHALAMEELQKEWADICKLPLAKPDENAAVSRKASREASRKTSGKEIFGFTSQFSRIFRVPAYQAGLAFALVLFISLGAFYFYMPSLKHGENIQIYSTARAEMRSISLEDGSIAHLNALSKIKVDYTKGERKITLEQGEALFDVRHNPVRPFLVYAGDGKIQAIGTRFNVKLMPDFNIMVTLVEGVVRVSQDRGKQALVRILKTPGAMASLRPFPGLEKEQTPEESSEIKVSQNAENPFQNILSWREGKLVFQGQRLDNVLYEINRHSNHRILLKNKNAIDLPVYAVFNAGDWRGALSAIVKSYPVKAVQVSFDETHLVADEE